MKSFFFVLSMLVLPQKLWAWADLGHQATAEVAERFLSPKGKRLVNEILGNGPLAEASTYGDFVKSDPAYATFADVHFVEIDPLWQTYDKVPQSLRPQRDADTILQLVPAKLFATEKSAPRFNDNQRKDMLKFLVHVVGDVHMPFHVGNSYDRGATWCDVKYPGNDGKSKELSTTNLHALWDGTLVTYVFRAQTLKDSEYKIPKYQGFVELADLILKDADIAALKGDYDKIAQQPISDWYKESQALHPKAYPDSHPVQHPRDRNYCKHLERDENGVEKKDDKGVTIMVPASDVAEVDQTYMRDSAEIIKLQILKGGLRLAATINKMAEKQYSEPLAADKKAQDIKDVLEQLVNYLK